MLIPCRRADKCACATRAGRWGCAVDRHNWPSILARHASTGVAACELISPSFGFNNLWCLDAVPPAMTLSPPGQTKLTVKVRRSLAECIVFCHLFVFHWCLFSYLQDYRRLTSEIFSFQGSERRATCATSSAPTGAIATTTRACVRAMTGSRGRIAGSLLCIKYNVCGF